MSARHPAHANPAGPVTRAQRRAQERAQHHRKSRQRTMLPGWTFLLGIGIIVAAVAAFAVISLNPSSTSRGASASAARSLSDPAALDPAANVLKVGTTAPNFSLRDAVGVKYSLSAYSGHPVLLEFFAVWCPVCQRETSVIHQLAQRFAPKGVQTLAVLANPYGKNFETSGRKDLSLATVNDLAWYAKQFKANYPLLIDPKFATVNKYGIGAYPGLYVIGKDGKILLSGTGYHDYNAIASTLRRALR